MRNDDLQMRSVREERKRKKDEEEKEQVTMIQKSSRD